MFFTVSCHIAGTTVFDLILPVFQCFSPYSRSYHVRFSFSLLVIFLAIFQYLQCAFLIYMFFSVSRHIPGHTLIVSLFPCFAVFSPKSRSHSVYFTYFTYFTVSHHIPGPAVCVSHYAHFSVFLTIFKVLLCKFIILIFCQFSRHILGPTM